MTDVWAAPRQGWTAVSPRLGTVRKAILAAAATPVAALVAALAEVGAGTPGAVAGVLLVAVCAVAGSVLVDRQWRAIGYAEREDDLWVRRGVMFRQLVVVPYGRMQFVDVKVGPVGRRAGIATVQLHTASAATDASIPGLEPAEAARLRDRLTALGEARSAGL